MNQASDQQQSEIFLRDDAHHMVNDMKSANFNIRNYHRNSQQVYTQNCNNKNKTLATQYNSFCNKLKTQPIEKNKITAKTKKSLHSQQLLDKQWKKKERNSIHKIKQNYLCKNLKQIDGTKDQSEGSFNKLNSYYELQKQHNKGRLDFKHIENWLNHILMQYCSQQYFDTTITNSALKKYCIDSNSLISQGISPNNVERIYHCFFVYSIGFNNLLKEITHNDLNLLKGIWKIFSLMLEYCAAGNYQTVIGELQRDKVRKIDKMRQEVQKRQSIIDKNEELNQMKNIEVFRQIKRLKDSNYNLLNERQILIQQFQETDQAFNQQVSLRLKFENKINQIYAVYRQLAIKHTRLYDDYNKRVQELENMTGKWQLMVDRSQQYKKTLLSLEQQHMELKKVNAHDKEYLKLVIAENVDLRSKLASSNRLLQEMKSRFLQIQRKNQQMKAQVSNYMILLEMREKSAKEIHKEYQLTLEENSGLYETIRQQRISVEELTDEKKKFNEKILKILAQSSFNHKKFIQVSNKYQQCYKQLLKTQENILKNNVQIQVLQRQNEHCKEDLQQNYTKIRQMHNTNYDMQQQLIQLRKYHNNMDKIMQQKDKKQGQSNEKISKYEKQLNQLRQLAINMKSKNELLQLQLETQKSANEQRYQQIVQEKTQAEVSDLNKKQKLAQVQLMLEKYKQAYQDTLMNFKNQKFQRNNLNTNYQQLIRVMKDKNQEVKQLTINVVQLKQEISVTKLKAKRAELHLLDKTQQFMQKISQIQRTVKDQQNIIDFKAHHIHPMYYEDIQFTYQRLWQNHQRRQEEYKNTITHFQQQQQDLKITLSRLQYNYKEQICQIQNQHKKISIFTHEEIQFEKQRNQQIKQNMQRLQDLQQTYRSIINQKKSTHRQEQYKKQLQQKQNYAKKMLENLQKVQNKYAVLQKQIKQVTKQRQKQREKNEKLQSDNQEFLRQKQQYKKKYQEQLQIYKKAINKGKKKVIKQVQIQEIPKDHLNDKDRLLIDLIQSKTIEQLMVLKNQKNKLEQSEISSIADIQMSRESVMSFKKRKKQNNFIPRQEIIQNPKRSSVSRKLKNAFKYYYQK